jgi:hypothetical protein
LEASFKNSVFYKQMSAKNHNSFKREVVVESDWTLAVTMVILLLFALFTAIKNVRAIIHGDVPQVTYNTVILAVCTGYLAVVTRFARLFRIGVAALALGATIRIIAHYARLSPDVQREAGMSGLVLSLFACIAIFAATIQWFKEKVHLQREC